MRSLAPLGISNLPEELDSADLRSMLLDHVVEGSYTATQIAEMEGLPTLGGTPLKIGASNGSVTVGAADIILSDREADNGYVHLIDSVLVSG